MIAASRIRGVHVALLVLLAGAWLVLALAALALGGHLPQPLAEAVAFLTTCPYRRATGDPCPFCGATTAAIALLRGDVETSLALSPLALALAPLAVSQPPYRLLRALKPRFSLYEELLVTGTGVAIAALVLALA